ncbi:MAG: hypothetical protein AB1921_19585 [Thermodesulfobacteriota bacterium]
MKELFQEILTIENVYGAIYVSAEGKVLFSQTTSDSGKELEAVDWPSLFAAFGDAKEVTMVYDYRRIYVRRAHNGYVLVLMGLVVPVSMVRLSCDALLPTLEKQGASKGLMRFFRRK